MFRMQAWLACASCGPAQATTREFLPTSCFVLPDPCCLLWCLKAAAAVRQLILAETALTNKCAMLHRYNVAALPEWPILIQDAVVDTPHAGDPAGVCRLKYDRKEGGEGYDLHTSR